MRNPVANYTVFSSEAAVLLRIALQLRQNLQGGLTMIFLPPAGLASGRNSTTQRQEPHELGEARVRFFVEIE